MRTFYSILYCSIRPNLDERVSIGLFVANEKECFFDFSKEKLNIIKGLLPLEGFQLLKSNLKALSTLASNCETDLLNVYKGKSFLTEGYFGYLSTYANNLLTYSKPIELQLELNHLVFNQLFEKFIFNLPHQEVGKSEKVEMVRRRLNHTIKSHVNFDIELTNNEFSGLVIPAKISFIGKNEVKVAGEMNDFNKSVNFLRQQVNAHLYLVEKIKESDKDAKFFFIGDEPSKALKENHEIWKNLKTFKPLDLVPTNEIERVEEYMFTHGVEPLIINN